MSQLAAFFKGSDTTMGVFYPENHLLAIFPDLESAREARTKLRTAGFSDNEVAAAPGADLAELVKEEAVENLLTPLMTEVSRFLHTEASYTDRDLKYARRGAAIIAVHCPDEAAKKAAWGILHPLHPICARFYAVSGIEHLAGET